MFSPLRRKAVEPSAPVVFGHAPFAVDETLTLEALESEQQRPGVHAKNALAHLFNPLRDPKPVHRLEAQRFQDEHVERALDDVRRWLRHGVERLCAHSSWTSR